LSTIATLRFLGSPALRSVGAYEINNLAFEKHNGKEGIRSELGERFKDSIAGKRVEVDLVVAVSLLTLFSI